MASVPGPGHGYQVKLEAWPVSKDPCASLLGVSPISTDGSRGCICSLERTREDAWWQWKESQRLGEEEQVPKQLGL